jgi:hypothetical protein
MAWPSAGVESLTSRPLCRETSVFSGSFFPVDGRLSGRVRRQGHSGRSRGHKIGQERTHWLRPQRMS